MKFKRCKKILLVSLILAILVTMVSGLAMNTKVQGKLPNFVFLGEPLLGATYYGYIFPWMSQIVYPGAEKEIIWSGFILDIIVSTLILFLVLKVLRKKKLINL